MEYTFNKFIQEIVEVLNDENKNRKHCQQSSINIPFVISALKQHLQDIQFESFIKDIENYPYNILYEEIKDGYYDYGKLRIIPYKADMDEDYSLGYDYSIILRWDQRDWGYCECEKGNDDYREDKGCCGHGCDWTAPAFELIKEVSLGYTSWTGDEHDYWDFEDDFYKSDKELAEEKAKKDKENKIKYLKENIQKMQDELSKYIVEIENNFIKEASK